MIKKERMKKSCEGCKALEWGLIHNYCWECSLGYDIDSQKATPKEICPKPRTTIRLTMLSRCSLRKKPS